ncbi:MAG: 4-hydroxy-3-methylbut-2-enyl diphosphate reductase [Burkholderiales bacterium]|nr:4-hydroxy-3-methylbut-2-enyl diphosphate reductase [Burkholderiales bacterium]
MKVILAQPRGFCAGVERAVEIVELALRKYGAPVYVRHEIVHNKRVVEKLRAKGARFVEELDEIPEGAITIFSAHGVSQKVADDANLRDLPVIDATCPLVAKVHREGQRYVERGYEIVLIGHEGHPEVEGTRGRIPGGVHLVSSAADVERLTLRDPSRVAFITQTTLSVDDTRAIIEALRRRFPAIVGPDVKDICYATQNRQEAVKLLCHRVDVLLVVGARNSSNSNRLREIGTENGVPSYLIDDAAAIDPAWFANAQAVGLTAGASAPEELVREVIERLGQIRPIALDTLEGIEENVRFKLPESLWDIAGSPYGTMGAESPQRTTATLG